MFNRRSGPSIPGIRNRISSPHAGDTLVQAHMNVQASGSDDSLESMPLSAAVPALVPELLAQGTTTSTGQKTGASLHLARPNSAQPLCRRQRIYTKLSDCIPSRFHCIPQLRSKGQAHSMLATATTDGGCLLQYMHHASSGLLQPTGVAAFSTQSPMP